MRTIYKYKLENRWENNISIPKGAEILLSAFQGPQLFLWARFDPEQPIVLRKIIRVGTGNTINHDFPHIVSLQQPPFVWHFFDGGEL